MFLRKSWKIILLYKNSKAKNSTEIFSRNKKSINNNNNRSTSINSLQSKVTKENSTSTEQSKAGQEDLWHNKNVISSCLTSITRDNHNNIAQLNLEQERVRLD